MTEQPYTDVLGRTTTWTRADELRAGDRVLVSNGVGWDHLTVSAPWRGRCFDVGLGAAVVCDGDETFEVVA